MNEVYWEKVQKEEQEERVRQEELIKANKPKPVNKVKRKQSFFAWLASNKELTASVNSNSKFSRRMTISNQELDTINQFSQKKEEKENSTIEEDYVEESPQKQPTTFRSR